MLKKDGLKQKYTQSHPERIIKAMKNLSSEEMERFGGFSPEKQKLGEKMIVLISGANIKGRNKDFWR